ncbi:MAG: replication initiation protein [Psychrilyobacter sp.]|uniref:replication initiation protein n=1 Tax=Psychrilyobacter sp. TaxID=2586924 RepID=UPI003C751218
MLQKNMFNLSEKDIILNFNKKFTKKENDFFEFITKSLDKDKNKKIIFSETRLKKIINIESREKIISFFKKISGKKIYYSIYRYSDLEEVGILNIISLFTIKNNQYEVEIDNNFHSIFIEGSYFYENNFKTLIHLKSNYSRIFFNIIKFNFSLNKAIELPIDKLKKALDIKIGSHDRFYDFEKLIIKPCLKDISLAIGEKINYLKIKKSESKNSKVLAIKIEIKKNNEDINDLRLLMESITAILKTESSNIWSFLNLKYKEKGLEYVHNNVTYAIDHGLGEDFENFLTNSITYDYFNTRFKNKISKFLVERKIYYESSSKIDSLGAFHSDIFKALTILKFYYLTLNPSFLKALMNIKNKNEFEYQDSKFLIIAEFNSNSDSHIYIFR